MIISHSRKFIFFAVPKTATHSIREVLHYYQAAQDWEQQALFRSNGLENKGLKNTGNSQQLLPIPELARLGHGHISVRQIKPLLDAQLWNDYFKFAFVRNPFDRFVSTCFFLNRDSPGFAANSLVWMKTAIRRERFQQRLLVRPQVTQLVDANGEQVMDFIGRFEALQDGVNLVLAKLELASVKLKRRNPSEHAHYRNYYDAELRELVAEFYRQDLLRFDYRF